jgi:hypothetical protein
VTIFTFGFFRFYLSAMPSLPPATLSEHSLSVFLLVLLPATVPWDNNSNNPWGIVLIQGEAAGSNWWEL